MELADFQQAIATHGLWAIFVGTFFEGETVFMLGGVAARQGLLNPIQVILAAFAGGFIGDQLFFALGYWRGPETMAAWKKTARKAVLVRRLVRKHDVPLMLASRFLYGFRMVIPLACGTAKIKPWRFMLLNFISALLWCCLFGGIGYFSAGLIFQRMDMMKGLSILGLVIFGVIIITAFIGRMIRKRLLKAAKMARKATQ